MTIQNLSTDARIIARASIFHAHMQTEDTARGRGAGSVTPGLANLPGVVVAPDGMYLLDDEGHLVFSVVAAQLPDLTTYWVSSDGQEYRTEAYAVYAFMRAVLAKHDEDLTARFSR